MTLIVELTEAAAFQVKNMMQENDEMEAMLRVSVNGGGCSGLSYGLGFAHEVEVGDELLEQHGLQIVVSAEDTAILKGTKIDYKQSLMGGGFTIENPNAIASCGCGSSFRTATKEGTPENC